MEKCGQMAGIFEVIVDRHPDVLVVALAGELDLAAASAVTGLVAGELSHLDRDVIFDLAALDFIDMAGTRLFAAAVDVVTRSGFRCSAVSASPLAHRVIEFSGLVDRLGLRSLRRPCAVRQETSWRERWPHPEKCTALTGKERRAPPDRRSA